MKLRTLLTILNGLDPDTELYISPGFDREKFDHLGLVEECFLKDGKLENAFSKDKNDSDKTVIVFRG